jgi:hypothetical protein
VDLKALYRIELGLASKGHPPSENPIFCQLGIHLHLWMAWIILLTGIPQFVLIPAPVTTTTLRDFPKSSAICCRSRAQPAVTCCVGIVKIHSFYLSFLLVDVFNVSYRYHMQSSCALQATSPLKASIFEVTNKGLAHQIQLRVMGFQHFMKQVLCLCGALAVLWCPCLTASRSESPAGVVPLI